MNSQSSQTSLTLIGMAGAGKSSIGHALAQELGLDFVDTDALITERMGQPLQTLIDQLGITAFRQCECETICAMPPSANQVIATGGSVVYEHDAMQHLKTFSHIVWLRASLETIQARIGEAKQRGLVLDKGQSIASLMHEREPLYRRYASITIDVDELSITEATQAIILPSSKPTNPARKFPSQA